MISHHSYFFKNNSFFYSFDRVFFPSERTMRIYDNARNVHHFDTAFFECFNDNITSFSFIRACDFFSSHRTCARNRAIEIISMSCTECRNITASLCPRCSITGMCMYNATNFRASLINFDMSICIGRWIIITFNYFSSIDINNYHIFSFHSIVFYTRWFDNH